MFGCIAVYLVAVVLLQFKVKTSHTTADFWLCKVAKYKSRRMKEDKAKDPEKFPENNGKEHKN